jgi:low affinity Fe/Cu permease
MQAKFEELFAETEAYKRQIVGIDELRRDRDQRIDTLRADIDELTKENEFVAKENGHFMIRI